MKRRLSKLIAVLTILTMVGASTGLAFAEKDSAVSEPITKTQDQQTVNSQDNKLTKAFKSAVNSDKLSPKGVTEGNNFVVTTIKKGTTSEFGAAGNKLSIINYNVNDDLISDYNPDYDFCGYSQKVTLKKGTMIVAATILGDGQYEAYANFGLFYDKEMDTPVSNQIIACNENSEGESALFTIPKDGTYYLGVYSAVQDSDAQNYTFISAIAYMSGADRTVTSGSQIAVGQTKAQTNYFKFKATKTGYIKVNVTDVKAKFKLCNSAKTKSLSDTSVSTSQIVYGVKKGVTYNVKVTAPSNANGGYTFKVTNVGVTESSGSTKAKAKTIYRGSSKAKKGSIIAGYSTPDWYKFKLTSSKAVNIVMKGATNNSIKISVYKGSKLIKSSYLKRVNSAVTLKSVGKLTKGTYYIKIARANSYSSGYYSCYWYYR